MGSYIFPSIGSQKYVFLSKKISSFLMDMNSDHQGVKLNQDKCIHNTSETLSQ